MSTVKITQFDLDKALTPEQLQERTKRICTLNDKFRKTFEGGRVIITQGVMSLNAPIEEIVCSVQEFDDFSEDNDPYGEHDFASFTLYDSKLMWKIDYFDENCQYGSEDASNPKVTTRVITILTPSEY